MRKPINKFDYKIWPVRFVKYGWLSFVTVFGKEVFLKIGTRWSVFGFTVKR